MARQKEEFLEPATSVIELFGGVAKVSRITKRHPSRVCALRISRARGGTGGEIPSKIMPRLRAAAQKIGKSATFAALLAEAQNESDI